MGLMVTIVGGVWWSGGVETEGGIGKEDEGTAMGIYVEIDFLFLFFLLKASF